MGIADQEITQLEFAEIVNITDRQLRNLKRTIPPSGKKGNRLVYKLGPAVQAYIAHVQGATQERYTARDLAEARIRKEMAQARKEEALARSAEVQAKRDEDAVVELAEVQAEMESVFANVKAGVRGIPSGMHPWLTALVGEDLAMQIVQKMSEAADEALHELYRTSEDEAISEDGKDES